MAEEIDSFNFEVTNIWIAKCKMEPVGNVRISESELRFVVKSPMESAENVTVSINTSFPSIVKTICHFGTKSTVLFYIAKGKMDSILAEIQPDSAAGTATESIDSRQWIILETSALTEAQKSRFSDIFDFFDEITSDEMDQMLELAFGRKKVKRLVRAKKHNKRSNEDANHTKEDSNVHRILEYPPNGKGAISISVKDYECLAIDEHLNDVIIDFYIEYLRREVLTPEQREKTHVFSTFFYNVLTARPPRGSITTGRMTAAQKRHERVKKWTKDVNIFEKDFIIIPINSAVHWFLAIVCFPSLKEAVNMVTGEPIQMNRGRKTRGAKSKRKSGTPKDDDHDALSQDEEDTPVKQPCILMFDSLGGEKESEMNMIRDYLNYEYAAKMPDDSGFKFDTVNMPGQSVRVPHQPNMADCGLFLLQNVEQFFKDPIKSYDLPIKGLDHWYKPAVATSKRKSIEQLIRKKMRHQNVAFPVKDLPSLA